MPENLRPLRADARDAQAVLAAFRSAADMARQGDVTDLTTAREQLTWLTAEDRIATAVTTEEDWMVGLVGISVDRANRAGWFFYWLHAEHRGQGLITRAARSVADRALAEGPEGWGLARLELGHRRNNPASGAIARAAGFVHEGTEREKFLVDGRRIDVLTYGRLVSDPVPVGPRLPWAPDADTLGA